MKKARTGMTDSKFEVFVYYLEVCYHFPKIVVGERGKENIIIESEASQPACSNIFLLFESQVTIVCSAQVKHFNCWDCVVITNVG